MTKVLQISGIRWSGAPSAEAVAAAGPTLEAGGVVFLPNLGFEVQAAEALLFTPLILGSSKNASFDPSTGRLGGLRRSGGPRPGELPAG